MKISVFIPTLNRADALKQCLESLLLQSYHNFEVVIVDGGSTDQTKWVVEEYRRRLPIVFTVKEGGLIAQANVGWQVASGKVVTRTDDDVIASPQWLEEIVKTFTADDQVGGVTGPTIIPEDRLVGRDLTYFNQLMRQPPNLFWRLFAKLYYSYFMEGQPFAVSRFFRSGAFSLGSNYTSCLTLPGLLEADHLEACNGSYRRDLLHRIGGYDPKYVGIGEYHEPDAAYKIKRLGYKLIFNPQAVVYHLPSMSGVFAARPHAYTRSQNFILFYFRHIKPNTPDKLVRFCAYLTFINAYWLFKFCISHNLHVLAGIPGTAMGLIKFAPELGRK